MTRTTAILLASLALSACLPDLEEWPETGLDDTYDDTGFVDTGDSGEDTGDTSDTDEPVESEYTQVECGYSHSCGLTVDGEIHCWAYNPDLEILVDTSTLNESAPFTSIDVGPYDVCGITESQNIVCHGTSDLEFPEGSYTQLDMGEYAADSRACAVTSENAVVCSDGRGSSSSVYSQAQAVGEGYCAYNGESDGVGRGISCFGGAPDLRWDGIFSTFSIGHSGNHACGLQWDDSQEREGVVCWDDYGSLYAPSGTYDMVEAGSSENCALNTHSGNLTCWGDNDNSSLSTVPGGTYQHVSVGTDTTGSYEDYACAITLEEDSEGGSVVCWGNGVPHDLYPDG